MKQNRKPSKKPVPAETRSVVKWINIIIAFAGIAALILFSVLYMIQYNKILSHH
ncbi:MAG: hypothetical protein U0U33_17060 [Chitinophagaceae bacterium]